MYLGSTFSKLTNEECKRLVDAGEVRTYRSGDVIIGECDTLQALMLVKTGKVRVTRTYLDDLAAEFAGPLGPGEVVGEMSFIVQRCQRKFDCRRHHGNARAATRTDR